MSKFLSYVGIGLLCFALGSFYGHWKDKDNYKLLEAQFNTLNGRVKVLEKGTFKIIPKPNKSTKMQLKRTP